jgi:hypothetical protein
MSLVTDPQRTSPAEQLAKVDTLLDLPQSAPPRPNVSPSAGSC